jgi:hypothetical protein
MGAILCLTAHSFVHYVIPQVSWGVEQKQEKFSGSKTMFFSQVSLRIVHKTVKICNPKKSQTKDQCEQYSKMILKVSSWKNAVFCAALPLLMLYAFNDICGKNRRSMSMTMIPICVQRYNFLMQIRKPLGLYNMKTGRYLTILKRWLMVTKVINNKQKKVF